MVSHGEADEPDRASFSRLPTAVAFGQYRCASARLTMATGCARSSSAAVKARPSRIRMPSAAKYEGVIARRSALSRSPGRGGGNPSGAIAPDELLPDNGRTFTAATSRTPGTFASSATAREKNVRCFSAVSYFDSGKYAGAVTTCAASNPAST
jgi:hypothetical protein